MTVKELIEKLKKFDENIEVVLGVYESFQLSEYTWDSSVEEKDIYSIDVNGKGKLEILSGN